MDLVTIIINNYWMRFFAIFGIIKVEVTVSGFG